MAECKEIYWHLTSKDNQNCRYYHKFTNIDKLNIENNKKVLDRISSKDGIKSIIFMSEEAFLYPNFLELAKDRGIKCELLINDLLFTILLKVIKNLTFFFIFLTFFHHFSRFLPFF